MIPPVKLTGPLEEARRLFKIYDKNSSGFLERFEIPAILNDTYRGMGMSIVVNQWDVDSYIRWMDKDNKGKISLKEFEKVVVRSLEIRGIKI